MYPGRHRMTYPIQVCYDRPTLLTRLDLEDPQ